MKTTQTQSSWFSNELTQGQTIIVLARWIMILAGLCFVLWLPSPLPQLRFKLMFLLTLAAGNFYLCAQLLKRQPAMPLVVLLASLADILVINAIVLSEGGLNSVTFIFYFPAMLAISVAFPTALSYFYASGILGSYIFLSLVTNTFTSDNLQILVIRLLMLTAVAVCGNLYWRQESRRQAVPEQAKRVVLPLDEPKAPAQQ